MNILTPESAILKEISESLLTKFHGINLVDINYFFGEIPGNSIVVSDNLEPKQVVEVFGSRVKSHLVQYNKNFFDQDIETAATLIESPDLFFENPGPVVLNQICKSGIFSFSSVAEKAKLIKDAELFLSQNVSAAIQVAALGIIEELYMNAVLDAPVEAGQPSKSKIAQLIICLSDDCLSITCKDSYGSLVPGNLLKRLDKVYKEGAGEAMQMKSGRGAGIGCMLMFEQSSGLFFGVRKGITTVVSVLISYKLGNKQRAEFKKNFHIIEMN